MKNLTACTTFFSMAGTAFLIAGVGGVKFGLGQAVLVMGMTFVGFALLASSLRDDLQAMERRLQNCGDE